MLDACCVAGFVHGCVTHSPFWLRGGCVSVCRLELRLEPQSIRKMSKHTPKARAAQVYTGFHVNFQRQNLKTDSSSKDASPSPSCQGSFSPDMDAKHASYQ